MRQKVPKSALLGDLVVAAYDVAAKHSSDPREVSRLATRTVMDMLRRARRTGGSKREGGHPLDYGRSAHDASER